MFRKEDVIKLDCRTDVLRFIRKRLNDITIADFYSVEEYELIRKEYMEMAENIRDKDILMELKEKQNKVKNKNVKKYFNLDKQREGD